MHSSNKDKKVKEPGPPALDSPDGSYLLTNAAILEDISTLRTELQATKVQISQTIDACIKALSTTVKEELLTLKSEIQNVIQALKTSNDQHGTSIVELERAAIQ